MKELEPLRLLVGSWKGSGEGPDGPFDVESEVKERGRWLLLKHAIFPPEGKEPFYLSTQVFGFDQTGLTLDYFDTAGSFKFNGKREKDQLNFEWKNGDFWKKSRYWTEDDGSISFHYQSMDADRGGEPALSEFKGTLKPK